MDQRSFRRKYLLGLLTSPLTLFPIVGGTTCAVVCGALGFGLPLTAFAGALGAAFGAAVFCQRLLLGCTAIARRAEQEVELEAHAAREADLDRLDEQLVRDRDPRTQAALRDLRALAGAFRKGEFWKNGVNAQSRSELLGTMEEIFRQCVASLRKTIELHELARDAATDEVRRPILAQRDRIVAGVRDSVAMLAKTLRELHELSASKDGCGPGLSQLGEELTMQLDIARRVDERMSSLGLDHRLRH